MKKLYFFLSMVFFGMQAFAQLPTLPMDFESPTINYTFTDFDGGATVKIANTQISGINTSANVARMIKSSGQVWGGSWISMAAPIDFSVNKTFKVKVYSPRVGAKLLLKVENATDPNINYEKEATCTVANAWEDLTFDYSTISTVNQYQKIVFIFDNGTMGDGTANFTFLFDDVRLVAGGGGGLTQMNLPVTFDDATVNYGVVGFGGAEQSSIVTDPTLPSNKVAKVIKTNTAELWAGTTVTALSGATQTGFSSNIPFTASATKMNVRVWSPHAGIQVRLKVEDKNDGTHSCETEATVTVASGWQTLEFNFANQAAGTAALNLAFNYNKASIFFNFGVTGATAGERIYYFDDVKFGAAGGGGALTQMNLPVTFDDVTVDYGVVGFGGAEQSSIVTDPTLASNKVAKVIKTNTAELWAGTTVTALSGATQTGFSSNIPFTASATKMNVRVWSPHAGIQVRLKVEDKNDGTHSCETEATVTVASGWQTLEFNFANQAAGTAALNLAFNYNKASIFFNFGVTGATAGERIYYFDDVKFGAAGGGGALTQMNLPVTFDDVTIDYGVVGFGGAEQSSIVTDPTLASNKVAKVIKTNTAELWAGTTVTALSGATQTGFSSNIPFTASATKMNVRVWSPHAGIQVRLKVEDKNDPTKSCETDATVTVASGWQTLEFNFANQSAGTAALNLAFNYNKASIFFNFGVTGATAGEKIYYFDDVKFGAAGGGGALTQMNLPVTFDDVTVDYGVVGFGGAEQSSIVTDPTLASNKVAKVIKTNTAELWAGTTVTALSGATQTGFSSNIPFTASATKMNVRVWSPHAGIQVRLKVEDKTNGAISCETEATVTVASGWQTLEFNFANQAAGTAALNLASSYNKVSIFFNFGVTGATAGERIYYFDDVKFGAAGGGGALTQMNLPVTFDDVTVNYGVVGFGGAEQSSIVTDPTLASNKVAKVIKTNTAELWAGTTVTALSGATQTGFSSNIPFTATEKRMNVRVWSPHAGIQVRVKVEDKNDPTKSCETEATVTVASGWQTLEFNFANQAAGTAALNLAFNYNKASIFFNFGVTGATAGERIYYFDDIKFGGIPLSQMNLPVTFDDPTVEYGLVGFGGAEQSSIVTDPTLAGNKVAKVIKTNVAELWAGTTVTAVNGAAFQTSFANNIPFTASEKRMNVRVWSPHAGIQVRLKVEDKNDPTKSCETEATVTVANGWQTLEFNFANQAAGTAALNLTYNLNKASIFFNFGVTGATAGERIYYFDDLKFGGANIPSAPGVTTPVTYCQTATAVPLTATASAGNTLLWYTVPTGGTGSATAPTPSTVTAGTTNYYVSQVNTLLVEGPRALIAVVINPTPGLPTVTTPVTYCQNAIAVPLTATAAAGNTLKWYTVATGGSGSSTAPAPSTTTAGNSNYYVSQVTAFGCEGPRAAINVVVNPAALAPIVTTPVNYCQNSTAVSLTATGTNLKWYTVAVGGFGSSTAPTPSTTTPGTVSYYVSQATALGCEGPRALINVIVNPTPGAPTTAPVTYCQNVTAVALTATPVAGNTLRWYTVATGGTGSATAPIPSTTTPGTVTYYVSQITAAGCEGARASLVVKVNPTPVAPDVVTPVLYCQFETPKILTATAATGNSLSWYNSATGGIGSVIAPTPITSTTGNTSYYVTQTNSFGCESPRVAVTVTINALPAKPVIGASPFTRLFPGLTTTITGTSVAGNTYAWFRNGLLVTGQSANSINVSIDGLGNYSLRVTNANGCINNSNIVTIADSSKAKLFIYPNPSTGKFQVRFNSDVNNLKPRTLTVYDSKGALVWSSKYVIFGAYTSMAADLGNLSPGIYHVYLMDNDGKELASESLIIAR